MCAHRRMSAYMRAHVRACVCECVCACVCVRVRARARERDPRIHRAAWGDAPSSRSPWASGNQVYHFPCSVRRPTEALHRGHHTPAATLGAYSPPPPHRRDPRAAQSAGPGRASAQSRAHPGSRAGRAWAAREERGGSSRCAQDRKPPARGARGAAWARGPSRFRQLPPAELLQAPTASPFCTNWLGPRKEEWQNANGLAPCPGLLRCAQPLEHTLFHSHPLFCAPLACRLLANPKP